MLDAENIQKLKNLAGSGNQQFLNLDELPMYGDDVFRELLNLLPKDHEILEKLDLMIEFHLDKIDPESGIVRGFKTGGTSRGSKVRVAEQFAGLPKLLSYAKVAEGQEVLTRVFEVLIAFHARKNSNFPTCNLHCQSMKSIQQILANLGIRDQFWQSCKLFNVAREWQHFKFTALIAWCTDKYKIASYQINFLYLITQKIQCSSPSFSFSTIVIELSRMTCINFKQKWLRVHNIFIFFTSSANMSSKDILNVSLFAQKLMILGNFIQLNFLCRWNFFNGSFV